jgi:hypothetical protein
MRRRFGVALWLRCDDSVREVLVTRLRAQRGIIAGPQGDLVLAMSQQRADNGAEACELLRQQVADTLPDASHWTVTRRVARRIRYQGGLRWGSGPSPDPEDYSDPPGRPDDGPTGVREPRRPKPPPGSGSQTRPPATNG